MKEYYERQIEILERHITDREKRLEESFAAREVLIREKFKAIVWRDYVIAALLWIAAVGWVWAAY